MTISQHIPQARLAQALGRTRDGNAAAALVLRWEISPDAIRLAPLPEILAMNGQAEKIGRAVLEWRLEHDHAAATLTLEIGEDDLTISLASHLPVRTTHDGAWKHLAAGDQLTISEHNGRVVYAKTTALTNLLGLPGGVYDAPSVG